jgi:hypothetical protein
MTRLPGWQMPSWLSAWQQARLRRRSAWILSEIERLRRQQRRVHARLRQLMGLSND